MFGNRFFAERYFPDRYFAPDGDGTPEPEVEDATDDPQARPAYITLGLSSARQSPLIGNNEPNPLVRSRTAMYANAISNPGGVPFDYTLVDRE